MKWNKELNWIDKSLYVLAHTSRENYVDNMRTANVLKVPKKDEGGEGEEGEEEEEEEDEEALFLGDNCTIAAFRGQNIMRLCLYRLSYIHIYVLTHTIMPLTNGQFNRA